MLPQNGLFWPVFSSCCPSKVCFDLCSVFCCPSTVCLGCVQFSVAPVRSVLTCVQFSIAPVQSVLTCVQFLLPQYSLFWPMFSFLLPHYSLFWPVFSFLLPQYDLSRMAYSCSRTGVYYRQSFHGSLVEVFLWCFRPAEQRYVCRGEQPDPSSGAPLPHPRTQQVIR